ncbi:MAG: 2-amino-4-hydroxy-6-hydroxymethyldihydropteridine diphosphokinase [Candidatus Fermentibacteraceae bacterium]|nr:2-amino-4-hydroxy-6-hydroxymethyldihydropteridine diphosphokinase [Candidatus Fermentibacteraceae bacterium]
MQPEVTGTGRRAFALGIGGNEGDVQQSIRTCISVLREHSLVTDLRVSSVYRTSPWGDVQGGEFLNCVACGLWAGGDLELLYLCRSVESLFSVPVKKNGASRELDVDVLFIEGGVSTGELTLPHPRMVFRKFVLVPLCDVWPHAVPGLGYTPAELLKRVQDGSSIIFHSDLLSQ